MTSESISEDCRICPIGTYGMLNSLTGQAGVCNVNQVIIMIKRGQPQRKGASLANLRLSPEVRREACTAALSNEGASECITCAAGQFKRTTSEFISFGVLDLHSCEDCPRGQYSDTYTESNYTQAFEYFGKPEWADGNEYVEHISQLETVLYVPKESTTTKSGKRNVRTCCGKYTERNYYGEKMTVPNTDPYYLKCMG